MFSQKLKTNSTNHKICGRLINSDIFSSPPDHILREWDLVRKDTEHFCSLLTPDGHSSERNNALAINKKVIIHMLNMHIGNINSPLLTGRAEDVFSSWDIISTMFIKLKPDPKPLPGQHQSIMSDLGLILSVPPQNIIGAYPWDVWFPNHSGSSLVYPPNQKPSYQLINNYFSGTHSYISCDEDEEIADARLAKLGNTYAKIASPPSLLMQTKLNVHNEVLVVGKSNINTYANGKGRTLYQPTTKVKVCGIFFQLDLNRPTPPRFELFNQLRKLNPNLPVITHTV